MSHTATVKTNFTIEPAIAATCREMGVKLLPRGTHRLYGRNTAEGIAVMLPGWPRPLVIDTAKGEMHFDDMDGKYGESLASLNQFKQLYAVHAATLTAQRHGQRVQRITGSNGNIQLRIYAR